MWLVRLSTNGEPTPIGWRAKSKLRGAIGSLLRSQDSNTFSIARLSYWISRRFSLAGPRVAPRLLRRLCWVFGCRRRDYGVSQAQPLTNCGMASITIFQASFPFHNLGKDLVALRHRQSVSLEFTDADGGSTVPERGCQRLHQPLFQHPHAAEASLV